MNKNIRTIASVMIVVLAIVLIVIFALYNSNRDTIRSKNNTNMHDSGEPILNDKSGDIEETNSGEVIEQAESGEDIVVSGENEIVEEISGEVIEDKKPLRKPERKEPPKPAENDSPVIVSRTDTSNQEKQEILNEIDDALKGLLDAVGKVKTVDESKLDASLESEVEP